MRRSEEASPIDKRSIDENIIESGSSMFHSLIWRHSVERDSDSSLEGMASGGDYVGDQSSILSLQPWVYRKETYGNGEEHMRMQGEFSGRIDHGFNGFEAGTQIEFQPRSLRLGSGMRRNRSSLSRLARRYSVRPLNTSVGNCLIPQLYDQHFEIDEYVFSSHPSQNSRSMRPFVVTDGRRVISKSSYGPVDKQVKNGVQKEVYRASLGLVGAASGFPSRPVTTPKRKSRDDRGEGLDTSGGSRRYGDLSHSQGSPDRMLLFSLGISIGVISTILSNKKEVEKLNTKLKHTENLVQDLQDELDMKESLTVKELVNEAVESQEFQESYGDLKENTDSPYEKEQYDQRHLLNAVEKSDSMSKIEAELEAELERLELNMNSSCLEGDVSALGELDSDLIGEVVHGELRADKLDSGLQECQAGAYRDSSSSTSTADTHNPNYAVSPRELSLRLHELIQHRLEERVKELERELQHSQKQLQFVEAERVISSQGTFSISDLESSDQESLTAQPLCLNLSGDALDAYEEAYEELMKMTDKEETMPGTNRSLIWGMEGDGENKASRDVEYIEGEITWKQILSGSKGSDECNGGDEYEIDDEEGKMIQQIVERTRQGSPVVLNAQRMLFTLEE